MPEVFSNIPIFPKNKKTSGFFYVFGGGGAWRGINEVSGMKLVKEIVEKIPPITFAFFMIEKIYD